MSHEPNRVCNEHKDFSKDCAVCKLEAARNDLARTFWYVKKFCEGPQPGSSTSMDIQKRLLPKLP
jgi:hypothetical protein